MERKLVIALLMLFAGVDALAQTPDMYPPPVPEPIEPTLFNIILYLVLPALMIAFYFYYRRKKRKEKRRNKNQDSEK